MATSPQFVSVPNVSAVTFVNADGTTAKTLWTPGSNGGRLGSISAVSDDTAAVSAQLYVRLSGTNYKIGTVSVPIGAGATTSVISLNLMVLSVLPFLDSDGALRLPSGSSVMIAPIAAVTAAKTATFVAFGGDF